MFNTVLPHGYMRLLGIHRIAKLAWEKKKSSSSFTVEIQVRDFGVLF